MRKLILLTAFVSPAGTNNLLLETVMGTESINV